MLYGDSDYLRVKTESEEAVAGRSPFRRDYARLLHSPSFRRLQGKTQLFPGHESDFFRNRLTHSLEVAQVAKGIALK
ncbi:MAG: deoxyguanosinetriphosphate triphosphohydrolase, partial [Polaromonas sp.]|nr:deoxyguanosinetriphosphate triphosphohydrolase [Polaromonas sp.]